MITNPQQDSPISGEAIKSPISQAQAVDATHGQARAELVQFAEELGLPATVSVDKLATLLEHLVKQQTSADSSMIRDQMVRDGWDHALGGSVSVETIAARITTFLASEKGIELFNFFVKIFARTTSKIYLDESSPTS